ncbi:MAG TPA: acetylxylan esterase, partial [Opitutaceae bacterium]|nr:acetylxylan esterase [Opitutaceae bacterium]
MPSPRELPWIFLIGLTAAVPLIAVDAPPPPASPYTRLELYTLDFTHAGSQLKDHIYDRSRQMFARGDAERDALPSPAAVKARQEAIHRFIAESLGGLPPSNTPLNARTTGTVAGNGFTIEKVIFESRPHHFVTANLYLPAQRSGRTGAVLFLSGHHNEAKHVGEYQSVCQTLVQAGLIVFAQDPIGQGERYSYHEASTKQATIRPGTRDHDYAGSQARFVGDSLGRYMLHDAMRGIDYLLTRPEVDPAKIGVTGNSGGGTQTCLVMLGDPRIAAAAPATFIMSRDSYQRTGQPQDAEQIWPGFTRAGYDHEDILLAVAPKPVCVLAVTSDFFPLEGTRRTVGRSRRIWNLFNRADAIELIEDAQTHSYTPMLARAAATFFAKHLLGKKVDPGTLQPEPMPGEKLWATQSGQVRGELPGAEFVFEANLARAREFELARTKMPEAQRKARAVEWLRSQVFFEREKNDLNPRRIVRGSAVGNLEVDVAFWYSQPYLANLGMLFRPPQRGGSMPVTIALWEDGTRALSKHAAWLEAEVAKGRAVFVVNLSGMGPLKPDAINRGADHEFYDTFHKLADDLTWIGDSLVALRTFELLRTLDVLATWPGLVANDVRLHASGHAGVHAKLAAALDPRIAGCDWENGFLFSDYVRSRTYETADVKSLML